MQGRMDRFDGQPKEEFSGYGTSTCNELERFDKRIRQRIPTSYSVIRLHVWNRSWYLDL